MRRRYFENQLALVRERFNQTFGRQTVVNVRTRYRVILSITALGVLCDKITRAKNPETVRAEIKRFCQTRSKLIALFNRTEKVWNEKETTCRNQQRPKTAYMHPQHQ